jgi:bifunctional non-homologous end joining protein LigD
MPLAWKPVRAGLDPTRFTVSTVPALWSRTPAWQDYGKSERSLEGAIKALTGSK